MWHDEWGQSEWSGGLRGERLVPRDAWAAPPPPPVPTRPGTRQSTPAEARRTAEAASEHLAKTK